MSADPLSSAVRNLITERIDSVGQLEIALLLHGTPDRVWTAAQVAAELRTSAASTQEQFVTLAQRDLAAAVPGGYRYAARGALNDAMTELAAAYRSYPVTVVTLIYSGPNRAVRSFANAFRLRKPPPEPGAPEEGGEPRG